MVATQIEKLTENIKERWGVDYKELLELYKDGTPREEIADILGTQPWHIRTIMILLNLRGPKKYREHDYALFFERFSSNPSPVTMELEEANKDLNYLSKALVTKDKAIAQLRAQLKASKAGVNQEIIKSTVYEHIDEVLSGITIVPAQPIDILGNIKHKASRPTGKTHTLLLSDLHFDETVRTEDYPANPFNWDIATNRLNKLFDEVARKYNNELRLDVAMMADFLSGTIHGAQESASKPIIQAVAELAELLADNLAKLSTVYPQIKVYTVEANHERLTDSPAKFAKAFDYSYMIYKLVQLQVKHISNIEFNISTAGYNVIPIANSVTLGIHHGDRERTPIGLNRTLKLKELFRQTLGVVPTHIAQGHLHQTDIRDFGGTYYICNPSFIGPGNYSTTSGFLGCQPAQLLLSWNADGTLAAVHNINL